MNQKERKQKLLKKYAFQSQFSNKGNGPGGPGPGGQDQRDRAV